MNVKENFLAALAALIESGQDFPDEMTRYFAIESHSNRDGREVYVTVHTSYEHALASAKEECLSLDDESDDGRCTGCDNGHNRDWIGKDGRSICAVVSDGHMRLQE